MAWSSACTGSAPGAASTVAGRTVSAMPVAACTSESKPRRVPHGPLSPQAESPTHTRCACRSASASGCKPNASSAPGRWPQTTTSARRSSASTLGKRWLPLDLRTTAGRAADHVGAERREHPRPHGPRDDAREIQRAQPGGRQRALRRDGGQRPPARRAGVAGNQTVASGGAPRLGRRPGLLGAHRGGAAAYGDHGLLDVACVPIANDRRDVFGVGDAQPVEQRAAMPGVVAVQAHPSVAGAQEGAERKEQGTRRRPVQANVPLAHRSSRHLVLVEPGM